MGGGLHQVVCVWTDLLTEQTNCMQHTLIIRLVVRRLLCTCLEYEFGKLRATANQIKLMEFHICQVFCFFCFFSFLAANNKFVYVIDFCNAFVLFILVVVVAHFFNRITFADWRTTNWKMARGSSLSPTPPSSLLKWGTQMQFQMPMQNAADS